MRKDHSINTQLRLTQEIALIGISAVIGVVITLAIPFICALLVVSGNMSESLIDGMSVGICAVGAVSAGFFSARVIGRRALLTGIVTGSFLFIILVVLGALFLEGLFPQNGVLPILISSVLGGTLGSVAGAMLK